MKARGKKGAFRFFELEEGDVSPEALTHKLPIGKRVQEPLHGEVAIRLSREATRLLGEPGRLLSASKTAYSRRYPDHDVVFNACLFDQDGTEIWFGDLDLSLEEQRLQQLADQIGALFLTPEAPYRFEGLDVDAAKRDPRVGVYRPSSES